MRALQLFVFVTALLASEATNIVNRPDARETLQQMQAELRRVMEQTRYPAPAPVVKTALQAR